MLLNLHQNRLKVSIGASILFHFSGVFGISSAYKDWFLQFTPLVLLFSTAFLFWNIDLIQKKLIIAFTLVFILGFAAELIGVHTGILFGSYTYGGNLGPKLWGVPFSIGINWAALCLGSAYVSHYLKGPMWLKIPIVAMIPVAIDYYIEPLCAALDFWHWQSQNVPLSNYTTWYICSLLFVGVFQMVLSKSTNRFAIYFLLIQFLFFVSLKYIML